MLARIGSDVMNEDIRWISGIRHWDPPGSRDPERSVWILDESVANTFPVSGVDVFRSVDHQSFWFAHRNRMIARALRAFSQHKTFLEVGSGSGVVAAGLQQLGYRVACVEPIASGALAAAARGIDASICGDLHSLKLPAGSVENVGLFDVIEHLEEPVELLREAARILRPDGLVFVTVPAHQWLWSSFDEWNGHFRRYSRSRLQTELADSGFEHLWSSYFFFPMVVPAVVRRLRSPAGAESPDEVEGRLGDELAPPAPINAMLRTVLAPETLVVGRSALPTGSSILFVGKPKGP